MVLSKAELLETLQREVQILQHLADKIDASMLDYRPTPKQRSTIELLRYLSYMGPALVGAGVRGGFDGEAWGALTAAADVRDLAACRAAIAGQADTYAALLADMPDEDFRREMQDFSGQTVTRGAFIARAGLGSHAAYRTQLFLYLKACGREELGTSNLWRGVDAPTPATA